MKTILDSYYTHEAILDKSIYSTDKKELTFYLKFCEWQLEELAEKGDNASSPNKQASLLQSLLVCLCPKP